MKTQSSGPLQSIQSTAFRVLKDAFLRAAAHSGGIDLYRASEEERNALLEPFSEALHTASQILDECVLEANRLGMQSQLQAFHHTAVEVYDGHDMLDEAMVYANAEDGEP